MPFSIFNFFRTKRKTSIPDIRAVPKGPSNRRSPSLGKAELGEPEESSIYEPIRRTREGIPFGHQLTHNEEFLISGQWLAMASTNVGEMRYDYPERKLYVTFLNGSKYVYYSVTLETAVAFVETDSPGRFVWNVFRAHGYSYACLYRAPSKRNRHGRTVRPKAQVVRVARRR